MADLILGIETSCDETAAAVLEDGRAIRSNVVASQLEVHAPYGGVVPELASRRHVEAIDPVIREALRAADAGLADLSGLAVTVGPGLVGSLLVGISAAKGIAYVRRKPLVGVNHLEGHIYGALLDHPDLSFPFIALVVSGGHTHLYRADRPGAYTLLGRTRDDAAGEAFDKVAKLLGLGYPGGPAIEAAARGGDPAAISFPRAAIGDGALDFSFSGLKTAVIHQLKGPGAPSVPKGGQGPGKRKATGRETLSALSARPPALSPQQLADLCASFQEAAVDMLADTLGRAAAATGLRRLVVAGGVACNGRLRERLRALAADGLEAVFPSPALCTDNAAMIAAAAHGRLRRGERAGWDLNADPSLQLGA